MAGNLVQGAVFTVMVVRAGILRDPGFETELSEQVRSGTLIYALGTDLVVTAPVSAGAEIMADGNIHVYAALRGRALAGAGGDAEARIFCSRLEAELVSIAGHYLVSDQIPPEHRGLPVQIALADDRLTIERN